MTISRTCIFYFVNYLDHHGSIKENGKIIKTINSESVNLERMVSVKDLFFIDEIV